MRLKKDLGAVAIGSVEVGMTMGVYVVEEAYGTGSEGMMSEEPGLEGDEGEAGDDGMEGDTGGMEGFGDTTGVDEGVQTVPVGHCPREARYASVVVPGARSVERTAFETEPPAEEYEAGAAVVEGVGGGTAGVTAVEAEDEALVPAALTAVAVKVYAVPLVRPVNVIGEPVDVAMRPSGEDARV